MEQIVQTSTVVVHSIHTVGCVHCTIQPIAMHVGIPSIVRAELRANTFGQVVGPGSQNSRFIYTRLREY